MLGWGHFKKTIVVVLFLLLRIIKDPVKIEIEIAIKARKSATKMGDHREIVEIWSC